MKINLISKYKNIFNGMQNFALTTYTYTYTISIHLTHNFIYTCISKFNASNTNQAFSHDRKGLTNQ